MKKTLAALSVLGAFAGSSLAADVTLYGVIDTGLVYQHADADLPDVDTVDTFQMKSGVTAGSRFGLKGTEDLGNGLKIGFVLENGFASDTGSFTQNNRLFGREAQLNLSGAFGTVAFGRMGSLASGNGTFGLLGSLSPFGTSWGEYAANAVLTAMTTRLPTQRRPLRALRLMPSIRLIPTARMTTTVQACMVWKGSRPSTAITRLGSLMPTAPLTLLPLLTKRTFQRQNGTAWIGAIRSMMR